MLATVARMPTAGCVALSCLTFVLGYTLGRVARRRTRIETRWNDQATFATLHLAAMAAPALRAGLTRDSARKAVRHLHALLGTHAVAITSTDAALAWDGPCAEEVLGLRARRRSPPGGRRCSRVSRTARWWCRWPSPARSSARWRPSTRS